MAVLAVAVALAGCTPRTGSGGDRAEGEIRQQKEAEVMPITMPARPEVATPAPAPKIGHLLGKGSFAIVKVEQGKRTLEIRNNSFTLLAKGELDRGGVEWPGQPWSPSGTALIYRKGNALRVIDFEAGLDRLLFQAGIVDNGERGIYPPFIWVGQKIVFHLVRSEGSTNVNPRVRMWMVSVLGGQAEEVLPVMADPADKVYLKDGVRATDVSRDGKNMLIAGDTGDSILKKAVFVMDIGTRVARRVSPRSEEGCSAGRFTADEVQILLDCLQPAEGINPVDVWIVNRDGSDPRRLAKGERVGLFLVDVSPDGSKAALHETFLPGLPSQEAIHIVDVKSGHRTVLAQAKSGKYVRPVGFSSDGKAFLILRQEHKWEYQSVLGTLEHIDLASGSSQVLADGVAEAFMAGYSR